MMKPGKSQAKKLIPLLESDYDSPEDAAMALIEKAYELYESQAKYYIVGQVRPGSGWKTPEEGRDAKVVMGPYTTRKKAESDGYSLAYSHSTGEESKWWAVEYHNGTPAAWYSIRKDRWWAERLDDMNPREKRHQARVKWLEENPGQPLPKELEGNGWDGLSDEPEDQEEGQK